MNLVDKIPKKLTFKKSLIISIALVVVGALFAFTKPIILRGIIRWMYIARPGHYVRWKHESKLKLTHKLYLWNITNPNEFATGTEKPNLKEVGPYVFRQYKRKVNSEDNDSDDTVSFNYWNIYYFKPDKTAPLTGDEMVTTFNPVIMSALVKLSFEEPHLLDIAMRGLDAIFNNPSSIFLTMTAMDFINKGIEINCDQKVVSAKMVCKEMRIQKALRMVNDNRNHLRFRWFDLINDTVQGRYTVLRGSKNIQDVGRVVAINGEPMLKVYKDNVKCNLINGTDKMFFPPFQQKQDILWVHAENACKSFPLRFKYMKRKRTISTAYKFVDLSDPLLNKSCECNKFTGCADKGTVDLSACLGFYVSISSPHFYLADENLRQKYIGMAPNDKLHESGIYFDLLTSGPILAYERFQINVLSKPLPDYPPLSKLSAGVWLPFLWYEESFSIPVADFGLIVGSILSKLTGVVAGYIMLILGFLGCNLVFVTYLQQNTKILPEIIRVKPLGNSDSDAKSQWMNVIINRLLKKQVKTEETQSKTEDSQPKT
ncbi:Sensory neuron membrane protein 1 [Pseudolycoriella hygida]|uniref:Sensory neuron membrane protein 1 n=1 Tax=Pseudolycoriella hygida TaxID=35572 RepID=A0A9Q0N6I9_9DIPT|nr:Sensory neuron membrane protein 1 [Pseudolycoriella hygida]